MNQVLNHQVNQHLNIASVGSGATGCLQTHGKHSAAADGEPCGIHYRKHGGRGRGSGNCKHQCKNWHENDPKSAKYCALAKSVSTLSKNVDVMATHISGKSNEDNDMKPAGDGTGFKFT